MIPIGDSVRTRTLPYVNIAIIITNLVVFLYEVALSQETVRGGLTELDNFIFDWGNIPACTFDALGRDTDLAIPEQRICDGQPNPLLTVFSAMFLHGSWLHVGGNMLFLWIFGDNIEDALGHVRYLVFYLLTGAMAGFAQMVVDPESMTPAVGASGAIFAVMGAYILLFPRARVVVLFFPLPLPAWVLIGVWFVMQLFAGLASLGPETASAEGGVAYFAHIGGFVAGALLIHAFMLGRPPARQIIRRRDELW